MNSVQQWLRFFEQVSCYCKQGVLLLWKKYPNHTTDIWDSLAIFLEGYAFERQGRKPDYSHAGVDALLGYRRKHNGNMSKNIAKDIWRRFSELLNNQELNYQNNPLCPQGMEYTKNYKEEKSIRNYTTSKPSIMEVVFDDMIPQKLSFTNYFRKKITENIQDAHNSLKTIQGTGDKIASLFLRDLAYIMEINLSETQNRRLLQPIDIWVARTVISLAGSGFSRLKEKIKNVRSLNNKSKAGLADWIIDKSGRNAVNPEMVNMGIWYFCSQIAISGYRLNRVLENLNDLSMAKSLAHEHAMWIKNACKNYQDFD